MKLLVRGWEGVGAMQGVRGRASGLLCLCRNRKVGCPGVQFVSVEVKAMIV